MEEFTEIFRRVKQASQELALLTDEQRSQALLAMASAIEGETETLLSANATDLQRMAADNPMRDRLLLTPERLSEITANMRHVATLPCPLGKTLKQNTLPNGLQLRRVSVPFGVIGVIYEARPNVTFDVAALCLKSGNACLLKCGKDAATTCQAATELMHRALQLVGINPDAVTLLPATHEAASAMLQAVGWVDLCIPRGGKRLIEMVRDKARVPVIETGAGVVHCYIDASADLEMASRIIVNAKCRRPSVCNTLDCMIVHRSLLSQLPQVVAPLAQRGVKLHADEASLAALTGHYPAPLLVPVASDDEWDTEWLSLQAGVKTVSSLDEALAHIARHGSGHSESIVTQDDANALKFQQRVDAACVYVNAPTSFTDGAQFGLGAEIGISTQKLGPRGPMALEEMTTCKWLIRGQGQVRE